jgi:hypothetical protein
MCSEYRAIKDLGGRDALEGEEGRVDKLKRGIEDSRKVSDIGGDH